MNFTYLVYESDSEKTFSSTVIGAFSSQIKADKFIAAKEKTSTWEVYSVQLMEMDVGDVDVILQDGEYLNISESYEISDKEYEDIVDEIVKELGA